MIRLVVLAVSLCALAVLGFFYFAFLMNIEPVLSGSEPIWWWMPLVLVPSLLIAVSVVMIFRKK